MARILVVEDNPQNLVLTTVILRSGGHEVVPAQDATVAERELAVQLPDLVLMDLALPGKDGYTLTRELRQRPATSGLPILAVSSFAMAGDSERAMAAGCTAYMTKPIRRAELLERVRSLLPTTGREGTPSPAGPTTSHESVAGRSNPPPPTSRPRGPEGAVPTPGASPTAPAHREAPP